MRRFAFLTIAIVILLGINAYSVADDGCPGNQYRDPRTNKCVTPGDDPSGVTDWQFRRELIEERQGHCKYGWCCPDKATHNKCLQSGDKEGVGRCKRCIKYDLK